MRSAPERRKVSVLITLFALWGCEGQVTVDLGTQAPADPQVQNVVVDLDGIEFIGGDALRFEDPLRIDLAAHQDGNLMRLFTDEELSDGRYTGVRLLFASDEDEEFEVGLTDGRVFPLTVLEGSTAEVNFTVDKDDRSRDDIVVTLDLRQSLSFDDDADEYSLIPLNRAVRVEDAGQVTGTVTTTCSGNAPSPAVYLFVGEDITPDDRDNAGVEPYLTTAVVPNPSGGGAIYTFRVVPEGDYTIALTCDGDEEDAAADNDLAFRDVANIRVRAEETTTRNLGS